MRPADGIFVQAVLFDLDGTLLDIDIDVFMARYLRALTEYTESFYPGDGLMEAIFLGTEAMMGEHPGTTNREEFYRVILERTGIDLNEHWGVFERFYRERFDGLRGDAGPGAGAREALDAALDLGLKVAIATNPMFPRAAVERRLAWAGLLETPVHLVTTFEQMHACKPWPAYYLQVAKILGVEPAECLMVGDSLVLDMSAADVGMRTYYVGKRDPGPVDHVGDLPQLAALLPRLGGPRA